ncbi:uncharacterized protein G2W53_030432 [Senna tora]|uniref:Uncharacterized protein n=1 Tax=Senna tora TaxID=362788 RepID=A0A834T791_9FABA|nr:uncharacterized protein G2W53_030432 [Senna tora]
MGGSGRPRRGRPPQAHASLPHFIHLSTTQLSQ